MNPDQAKNVLNKNKGTEDNVMFLNKYGTCFKANFGKNGATLD